MLTTETTDQLFAARRKHAETCREMEAAMANMNLTAQWGDGADKAVAQTLVNQAAQNWAAASGDVNYWEGVAAKELQEEMGLDPWVAAREAQYACRIGA